VPDVSEGTPAAATLSRVFAPVTASKTELTRSSRRPLFSSATTVFSKVGGSGLSAITRTSASCCAMPASIAG